MLSFSYAIDYVDLFLFVVAFMLAGFACRLLDGEPLFAFIIYSCLPMMRCVVV